MQIHRVNGFEEDCFRVTWAPTRAQLRRSQELRAEVFCRELRWVGAREDGIEQDEFDAHATHIIAADEPDHVVATVRLIPHGSPWMLTTVFQRLMPIATDCSGAVEASRLAVAKRWRSTNLKSGMRISDLLYKGAYAYCAVRGIRHVYMVTSDVILRHLARARLPVYPIGPVTEMPDGVHSVAVKLDWSRLRENVALWAWYESGWRDPRPPPGARDGSVVPHEARFPMASARPPALTR